MRLPRRVFAKISLFSCAALWLAACGPRVRDPAPRDLQVIIAALDRYCLEHADYPATLDDPDVRARLQSYEPSLVFTDRWGRSLEYRRTGPGAFELRSGGPDGQVGNRDDLVARRGPALSP